MTITSDPPGSLVYMNDQELGRTPFTRDFYWYGNYDVKVRKDGYQTLQTVTEVNRPIYQWIPIDLLAELVPFWIHDRQHFNYALKPATTQPDVKALLAEGESMRGELESSPNTPKPTTAPSRLLKPTTQPARSGSETSSK